MASLSVRHPLLQSRQTNIFQEVAFMHSISAFPHAIADTPEVLLNANTNSVLSFTFDLMSTTSSPGFTTATGTTPYYTKRVLTPCPGQWSLVDCKLPPPFMFNTASESTHFLHRCSALLPGTFISTGKPQCFGFRFDRCVYQWCVFDVLYHFPHGKNLSGGRWHVGFLMT